MKKQREIAWIIIAIILFEFIIFFPKYNLITPSLILAPILIILVFVLSKKIVAPHFSIKIEHKIWEFERFGWYKTSKLEKPFQIGLILPILISILTLGFLKPLLFLQTEIENIPEKRLLKKRGLTRKLEINESDISSTCAVGFYSLILLAIIGILIDYRELARYAIFYGFWNLIPFGNLDGTKLFFGSIVNWIILATIYIIALVIALII